MMQTHETDTCTCKVPSSTRLRGVQCSPELGLMSRDFRVPENLIFPALITSCSTDSFLSPILVSDWFIYNLLWK